MRRSGLGLLIVIVLATNAFVLVGVARNRSGEPDARIELTERELGLPFRWEYRDGNENTGLALRLRWNVRGPDRGPMGDPLWLDAKKLVEVGFDCSVPVTAPQAAMKYGKMLPRQTYAVLEHDGDSWKEWLAERETEIDELARKVEHREETSKNLEASRESLERSRRRMSRLFVVDVGNDPERLRIQYPDTGRFIIAPALVQLRFIAPMPAPKNRSTPERPAYLRGSIVRILVDEVHVPPAKRRFLYDVLAADQVQGEGQKKEPFELFEGEREPRYAVTLRYGRRYEPWVVEVRSLEPVR